VCPYAASAVHILIPPYDGSSWRSYGVDAGGLLVRTSCADLVAYDGFVIVLESPLAGSSPGAVSQALRGVIDGLLDVDGAVLDTKDIRAEGWWLQYRGARWFVIALAPCYSRSSSRAVPVGETATFLVFQPAQAFDRRSVPIGTTIPIAVRKRIRESFDVAGRAYDVSLMSQGVESIKFVAPLEVGDEAIIWWNYSLPPHAEID